MKFLVILALLGLAAAHSDVGGLKDADVNDPHVKAAADFAFHLLANSINSIYTHKMGKLIKAQTQVVSGIKYYLSFEFQETDCKRNEKENTHPCNVTKTEVCVVQVWTREWLPIHKNELVSFHCAVPK